MVGRLLFFGEGLFAGAMLVSGRVQYLGVSLNSGSQCENNHRYFTMGPRDLPSLFSATVFGRDPFSIIVQLLNGGFRYLFILPSWCRLFICVVYK